MHDDAFASSLALFRSPEGAVVVEAKRGVAVDRRLVDAARDAGADLLWVQAPAVDAPLGFRRRGAYARFEGPTGVAPVALPRPPHELVQELERSCFSGVWGHPDPGEPDPEAIYVGLYERREWVGICEADAAGRWIFGPGVLPHLRTTDRYVRLVRGAAAALGPGPARLETWGDDDATLLAYRLVGFLPVEYMPAWELDLRQS